MTDIRIMREAVSDMYSGPKWKQRVARMPEDQIIAIYFRDKKTEEETQAEQEEATDAGQGTLF